MYGPVTYTDINTIIDAMLHYADQNGYPATHRMLQVEGRHSLPNAIRHPRIHSSTKAKHDPIPSVWHASSTRSSLT